MRRIPARSTGFGCKREAEGRFGFHVGARPCIPPSFIIVYGNVHRTTRLASLGYFFARCIFSRSGSRASRYTSGGSGVTIRRNHPVDPGDDGRTSIGRAIGRPSVDGRATNSGRYGCWSHDAGTSSAAP
jgi:hypothetical protein